MKDSLSLYFFICSISHGVQCYLSSLWASGISIAIFKIIFSEARDAVAKALYGRLFSWIVNKVNTLLAPTGQDPGKHMEEIGEKILFRHAYVLRPQYCSDSTVELWLLVKALI